MPIIWALKKQLTELRTERFLWTGIVSDVSKAISQVLQGRGWVGRRGEERGEGRGGEGRGRKARGGAGSRGACNPPFDRNSTPLNSPFDLAILFYCGCNPFLKSLDPKNLAYPKGSLDFE